MEIVHGQPEALSCWQGQPQRMSWAHRHDDVELNWCRTGELVYLFGGDRVAIPAGGLAAFWAAAPHQLIGCAEDSATYWLTVPLSTALGWELAEPFVTDLLQGRPLVTQVGTGHTVASALFDQWIADFADGTPYLRASAELEIAGLLRRLALQMSVYRPGDRHPEERAFAHAAAMARYITEHFADPLKVTDIARSVHLHPGYAMTVFRSVIGVTLSSYLTQCRVAEAQRLLISTNLSIAQIGHSVGFQSQSRFYDAFARSCGQPPATYRQSLSRPS